MSLSPGASGRTECPGWGNSIVLERFEIASAGSWEDRDA
jgi:hypothetical protein